MKKAPYPGRNPDMKPIEHPHNREAAAIIAASRLKSKEEIA